MYGIMSFDFQCCFNFQLKKVIYFVIFFQIKLENFLPRVKYFPWDFFLVQHFFFIFFLEFYFTVPRCKIKTQIMTIVLKLIKTQIMSIVYMNTLKLSQIICIIYTKEARGYNLNKQVRRLILN